MSAEIIPGGERDDDAEGAGRRCLTCGDVADPMTVLRVDSSRELALCEDEHGEHRTVEIALIDGVARGDALLVHAGTAIARAEEAIG